MAAAAHIDNARRFGCQDLWHYKVGEEKVSDVVAAKLQLNAFFRLCVWPRHESRAVDYNVDVVFWIAQDLLRSFADLLLRGEIKTQYAHLYVGARWVGLDLIGRGLNFRQRATGEYEERG